MSLYYDFHIHSCLSPCADDDMTPMNIAGMAYIKGLDVIALTDHNCGKNLPAMAAATEQFGLMFVPGIEATTAEEVHLLSYFKNLDSALKYCSIVYDSLPNLKNNQYIFSNQIIYNEKDEKSGTEEKMLAQASSYTLEQLSQLTKEHGGAPVPAHITRSSFSLISNLGYVPEGLFEAVELYRCTPYKTELKTLCSSDSHSLQDIQEKCKKFVNIYTISQIIDYLTLNN